MQSFAFIVDSKAAVDHKSTRAAVINQMVAEFGEKAILVDFAKQKSGTIRALKQKGIPVTKSGGKFYLYHDKSQRIVWATIDVPTEYIIRKMGGTPGQVDLSELDPAVQVIE